MSKAAGMSILSGGGVFDAIAAHKEAKAAKKARAEAARLDAMNRAAIQAENEEGQRRLAAQQDQDEGRARAGAAASGIMSATGSLGYFLEAMDSENTKQLEWLKKSGKSQLDVADQEARMRWQASKDRQSLAEVQVVRDNLDKLRTTGMDIYSMSGGWWEGSGSDAN